MINFSWWALFEPLYRMSAVELWALNGVMVAITIGAIAAFVKHVRGLDPKKPRTRPDE
jgi:hypothetical protein